MDEKINALSRWRHAPSDAEWAAIEPLMSGIQGGRGRPARDNRRFFHAVCWILQTGSPWRDLPADFGKWRSIHDRFLDWAKRGWWTKLFEKVRGPAAASVLSLDSTIAKAAPCASGAQKRKKSPLVSRQRQALGKSHGGLTCKIHAAADENGQLVAAFLTPGQASDPKHGPRLCRRAAFSRPEAICADKAYDTGPVREAIAEIGALAAVPSKKNRKIPIPHDACLYKKRNVVERFFRRLKEPRKIGLRTDKLKKSFEGWVFVAAARVFLASLRPTGKQRKNSHKPIQKYGMILEDQPRAPEWPTSTPTASFT